MTHLACKSKLWSVVWPSMHPCPGNSVAIRHTVTSVIYPGCQLAAISAETKCRHWKSENDYEVLSIKDIDPFLPVNCLIGFTHIQIVFQYIFLVY